MEVLYRRIPLTVDALFYEDGRIMPQKLWYKDRSMEIMRVMGVRRKAPLGVRSVAPLEYTVLIDGRTRKLYYEADSSCWFTVAESRRE